MGEAPSDKMSRPGLRLTALSSSSFIESLTAKVHPTPPNIDNLSRLFQDFYATASTHINTHVASLLSRHNREREQSPAPSLASRTSASSIFRVKAASIGGKDKPRTPEPKPAENERQMITAEELADRKRARKAIEAKRGILEEAVERRLCESIYDKIYRHHTTQDEAQDAKLRSKTAALAVVGIGPADLGVNLGMDSATTPEAAAEKSAEIGRWLFEARRELIRMSEKRYPLGKLHHLKAVHKCIVDTLAHFHPSSSADEIMPMLIYTLITLPPDKLHVISDVNFIHRFRWEPRLTGESAYCLTNLEAAISFLETVDLSTLRADESPSGPPKPASTPAGTPRAETFPPAYSSALFPPGGPTAVDGAPAVDNVHPLPSPSGLRAAAVQLRNRRLSDLIPTPAQAIGAASDAVRTTADQGLRNIGNIGASLGESYKFLWGRLAQVQQQQQQQQTNDPKKSPTAVVLPVPQTLDDARKLVSTPPPQADDEGSLASGSSSLHNPEETLDGATGSAGHKDRPLPASPAPSTTATTTPGKDDRTLNLIAGNRKPSRDHSADSSRSAGGASLSATTRRVMRSSGPGEDARDKTASTEHAPSPAESTPVTSPSPSASALESMRSLGSSLNPMSRIAGISMIRGFGRSMASSPSTPAPPVPAKDARISVEGGDLATVCCLRFADESPLCR